jgi:hypothetical protein
MTILMELTLASKVSGRTKRTGPLRGIIAAGRLEQSLILSGRFLPETPETSGLAPSCLSLDDRTAIFCPSQRGKKTEKAGQDQNSASPGKFYAVF